MADLASSSSSIEKLNHNNYSTWSIRMQCYLLGQDLQNIVKGSDTTPLIDDKEARKWRIKAGKAMYMLSIIVEDELLHHFKRCQTTKGSMGHSN